MMMDQTVKNEKENDVLCSNVVVVIIRIQVRIVKMEAKRNTTVEVEVEVEVYDMGCSALFYSVWYTV